MTGPKSTRGTRPLPRRCSLDIALPERVPAEPSPEEYAAAEEPKAVPARAKPVGGWPVRPVPAAVKEPVGASVNDAFWSHIVVWKAGRLVHDPHPLGYGHVGAPVQVWQVTDL